MNINETRQTRLMAEDRWYIEEALRYMFDVERVNVAPKGGGIRMRESPVTISYITREEFERRYGVWGYQKKADPMEAPEEVKTRKGIAVETRGGRKNDQTGT